MADDKKPKEVIKTPCPVCMLPREQPCGRANCAIRRIRTADIPQGLTITGRIDTRTREWEE